MGTLFYFIYLLIFFYSIFITGFSFLRIINYKSFFFLEFITGVSLILIFSNFFYFILNFNLKEIILFLLLYSIFFSIFCYKENIIKKFFSLELFLIFIVISFGVLISLYYGEQFYVFRGNHYDHTWYVANSVLIKKFRFFDYYGFFNDLNLTFVIKNLDQNLFERPAAALFMSFFLYPKFVDIFFSAFIFKFFLVSLSGLSFLYFIKIYLKNKILDHIILFFFFCFSFWTLYIFEIDALSQLFFLIYFIFLIKFFTKLFIDNNIDKKNIIIFTINLSAGFLIYPQQFLILLLIITIFFIFDRRKYIIFFFYKNYQRLFIFLLLFFFFTSPHYQATYGDFYKTYQTSIIKVDWWGYYGAFILGSESIVLNRDIVEILKKIIQNNDSIIFLLKNIINYNFDNEYYFIFFNIPISLLGFYFLTPSDGINLKNIFLFFLCTYITYYILVNIFHNICIILKSYNSKIKSLYLSLFFSFSFIFFINLIDFRIWQLVKLYFFYSTFLIILIFFNFYIKNKKVYFKINYLLILISLIFPFYKYSVFNNGIGRYDSFPSIINVNLKKSIYWKISEKDFNECNKIYIDGSNMDEINKRYIFLRLINLDINFDLLKNKKLLKDNNCKITLDNGVFRVLKY